MFAYKDTTHRLLCPLRNPPNAAQVATCLLAFLRRNRPRFASQKFSFGSLTSLQLVSKVTTTACCAAAGYICGAGCRRLIPRQVASAMRRLPLVRLLASSSVRPSVRPSVCLSVCPTVCQSVFVQRAAWENDSVIATSCAPRFARSETPASALTQQLSASATETDTT